MSSSSAYQVIHDELMLDGNARQNLATFVTTWMEPEVASLMAECPSASISAPTMRASMIRTAMGSSVW